MWRSALLGLVAGMRSQLPAALLAWRSQRGDFPHEVGGPRGLLNRRGSVPLGLMAAAGEMVSDKLPTTPSRLEEGPFVSRLALGAAAGSGIAAAFGRSRVLGGLIGAAGAAAGSVAGHRFRVELAERTNISDTVWGVVEDVVAVVLALVATTTGGGAAED